MGEDTGAAGVALRLATSRGARCGTVTVVLIDGPAGSGKTTLAAALLEATERTGARCAVVHMDDLYAGWSGLREGGAVVTELLTDLASGDRAGYRRFDWGSDRYAETVLVPPVDVLVVEGVGSARTEHLHLASVLVWVEEPDAEERLRRGLARDGEAAEAHWRRWMAEEATLFAEVGTRRLADVLVDGVGGVRAPA